RLKVKHTAINPRKPMQRRRYSALCTKPFRYRIRANIQRAVDEYKLIHGSYGCKSRSLIAQSKWSLQRTPNTAADSSIRPQSTSPVQVVQRIAKYLTHCIG